MSKVSILENAYQVTQGYCLIRAIDRTHLQIGVFDINKQLLGSEVISGRIENQRFCRNQAMAFIQKFNMEFEVVTESYTFHVQSLNLPAVIFNVSSKSGICMADERCGTNDKSLSIDRLLVSTNVFTGIQSSIGVSPLPKVQVMRVMCDVLTIALAQRGIRFEDLYLTNPSASKVGSLFGITRDLGEYCDEFECLKMMDLLMQWNDDEAFAYIESVLSKLKSYKKCSSYDFSQIFLPNQYDSYGFPVSREIKKRSNTNDVEKQFISALIHNFCSYLVSLSDMEFVRRLIIIYESKSKIGVHELAENVLCLDKLSKKYNSAVISMYNQVFTKESDVSKQTVEDLFGVFDLLEKVGVF